MLVAPNARWRCSSQLSPSTGVTTCAYPDTDSSKRRRTPTAYDPILDFLFAVRSIFVLLGLVVSRCPFKEGSSALPAGVAPALEPVCPSALCFLRSGRLPRLGRSR